MRTGDAMAIEEDAREASIENVMELHLRNRAREEAVAKVKVEPSEALRTEPSDDEEKFLLDNILGKQPPTELEDVQTKIKSVSTKITKLMASCTTPLT